MRRHVFARLQSECTLSAMDAYNQTSLEAVTKEELVSLL